MSGLDSLVQAFGLDWQFWAVTAVALWGVWTIVRPFLPRRFAAGGEEEVADGSPCGHCASGAACVARQERETAAGETPHLVTLGSVRAEPSTGGSRSEGTSGSP